MPIIGPYRPTGSLFFRDHANTHTAMRSARKSRIRELFISSDYQNTAYLGLFLSGARYGLRLDLPGANPGSNRAQISVIQNRVDRGD